MPGAAGTIRRRQSGRVSRLVELARRRRAQTGFALPLLAATAIGSTCTCISPTSTAPTRPASPIGSGPTAASRRRFPPSSSRQRQRDDSAAARSARPSNARRGAQHRRILPRRARHRRGRPAADARHRDRRHSVHDDDLRRDAQPPGAPVRRARNRWRAVRHQRPLRERRQHAAVRARRRAGPSSIGRHTVGYWFWEVEQFPAIMRPAFDIVDEVWTATDFVAEAVRAVDAKPVFTIPLPVPVPQVLAGHHARPPRSSRAFHVPLRVRLSEHRRAQEPARPDRSVQEGLCARRRAGPRPQEHQRRAAPGRARTAARRGRQSAGRVDCRQLLHRGREERAPRCRATATCRCTGRRAWA